MRPSHPLRDATASSNIFTPFSMHMRAPGSKLGRMSPHMPAWHLSCETGAAIAQDHTPAITHHRDTHAHAPHTQLPRKEKSPGIYACTIGRSGAHQASNSNTHTRHTLSCPVHSPSKSVADMQLYALQPTEAAVANNSNRFGCTTMQHCCWTMALFA